MSYNIPFRQIFLDDSISTETTGVSLMTKRRRLANNLYSFKYLSYASTASTVSLAYLAWNKKYTNRHVYLYSLLGSILIGFFSTSTYISLRKKCLEEFKCKKEELHDYAWFYNYSIIDLRRQ